MNYTSFHIVHTNTNIVYTKSIYDKTAVLDPLHHAIVYFFVLKRDLFTNDVSWPNSIDLNTIQLRPYLESFAIYGLSG